MLGYQGHLYSGVRNGWSGCEVWRYDGSSWIELVGQGPQGTPTGPGFGDSENREIGSMVEYENELYLGTVRNSGGCQVWKWNGKSWEKANSDGFNDNHNVCASSMAVYEGNLYVGTYSFLGSGCEVWRHDGISWEQVNEDGFGSSDNIDASSIAVYEDRLYVGTYKAWDSPEDGCEVWSYDGESWNQDVGHGPEGTPGTGPGFGDHNNQIAWSMHVYRQGLHVGTKNTETGAEIWCYNGQSWNQINTDGFGEGRANRIADSMAVSNGTLYVGLWNEANGCEVWSYDNQAWSRIQAGGFGDGRYNPEAQSLTLYKEALYAGILNERDGCEVWRYGSAPPLPKGFYFAEGYTGTGFQEYLCIGNAGTEKAAADVTYIFKDGTTQDEEYTVNPQSRTTVNVNEEVGSDKEVSIKISDPPEGITAERPMYFSFGGAWPGGHNVLGYSPGVESAQSWYFAEGTTRLEFDEFITVMNPNASTAGLTFHYMVEGEGETIITEQVGANTRATFSVYEHVGAGKDVSLHLESTQNVVAERPMYFNYQGFHANNWTGGHCVVGVNAPGKEWSFAEGTTRDNAGDGTFEEWLCIQNPNDAEITVTATYYLGGGQGGPVEVQYAVPPKERKTVSVNQELGADKDASVKLTSENDFIAERPMYFNYHNKWTGGHNVMGTCDYARTWFFAEGFTGDNFEEWLCIQNPGSSDANVVITYFNTSGVPILKPHLVPANSRYTVGVNADAGAGLEISARVDSDQDVLCERPIYFLFEGWAPGGHDVVGYTP